MKLLKLLYLADREALIRWGRPITFDSYVSMPHGPVLSFTLDRINAEPDPEAPSYWHQHISERRAHELILVETPPIDQLSRAELDLVNEIFQKFGRMDQWQLRDYTHDHLPEWRDPQGSSVPIQIRRILLAGGVTPDRARRIEEDLEAEIEARNAWS